jgi:hypothetical protein
MLTQSDPPKTLDDASKERTMNTVTFLGLILTFPMPGMNWNGGLLVVAIICSFLGLSFLFKAMRDDRFDECGIEKAPLWVYYVTGIAFQIPTVVYMILLRNGY